jgi:putative ATP-dependent endonuclease of the OLD family
LEDSWSAKKLDLVPGEEMLETLFERHGLKFRKDRDGRALAALLFEDEVHQDLRSIINDVAREEA